MTTINTDIKASNPLRHHEKKSERGSASYYLLLIYLVFVLLRFHEYMPSLSGIPIMPALLIMAVIAWLSNKRSFASPSQHKLMPLLLLSMTLSTAIEINGSYAMTVFAKFYPVVILYFLIVDAMDNSQNQSFAHAVRRTQHATKSSSSLTSRQTSGTRTWNLQRPY